MANNSYGIFGGYAPDPDPHFIVTPLGGLQQIAAETRFSAGCAGSDTACTDYNTTDIAIAVKGVELVVVCLGTGTELYIYHLILLAVMCTCYFGTIYVINLGSGEGSIWRSKPGRQFLPINKVCQLNDSFLAL